MREWFAVISRNLNTASAFLLSLFSGRSYRRTAARHAVAKQQAWHRWWHSARGTFNALIEQEGLAGTGDDSNPTPSSSASSGALLESQQPSGRLITRRASSGGRDSISSASSGGNGHSRRWRFWRRNSGGRNGMEDGPSTPSGRSDLRRGTVLFELPSGFAVAQVRCAVCAVRTASRRVGCSAAFSSSKLGSVGATCPAPVYPPLCCHPSAVALAPMSTAINCLLRSCRACIALADGQQPRPAGGSTGWQ